MPELPEVEAARRAVEDHCVGQKIKRAVVADDPIVIEGVSPSDFQSSLVGKTIVAAKRKGKNMWLQLDSPPFPSFQFGMSGAIYIKGVAVTKYKRSAVKDTDEWPSKYSKVFIELENGLELSFTDKRRFARVRLLNNPTSVPPISELGPDALLEPMTVDEFTGSLTKKKIAIKTLLLNQSFIAGIGNWIADEVLYQAKIHPLEPASSLAKESCATLHKCIKEVIQFAVQVDAQCSLFPLEWLFHFRWGKKPGKVNGKRIDFLTAGGRTTAYVPDLQKLSGANAVNAANKKGKQTSKRKKRGKEEEEEEDDGGGGSSDGNNDDDGVAIEEDKLTETAKLKNARKPRGQGRKSSTRRKPKESHDESDEAEIGEEDENAYGNSNNEQKKRTRGAINRKDPEKAMNKKTQPARNSQKQKKRAK